MTTRQQRLPANIQSLISEPTSLSREDERRIGPAAWIFLVVVVAAMSGSFLLFDPQPNLLLSACVGANTGIILWTIYQLYIKGLLLSPANTILIGSGLTHGLYTWGNLGPRIAGEGGFGRNPGSLEYYPLAALLSTIGLILFSVLVLHTFARKTSYTPVRYEDLSWQPWQVVAATIFTLFILAYLSLKYEFDNASFLNVTDHIDRWLVASRYFFVVLSTISGVSLTVKSQTRWGKVIGFGCLALIAILLIGLRSRYYMLTVIVFAGLCWLALKPRNVERIVPSMFAIGVVLFLLGTVVKAASVSGENTTSSILENLLVVQRADLETLEAKNQESWEIDYQYRLAGFEYPAALLRAMDNGAPPMYGEALYGGVLSALPGFIRPEGLWSERLSITRHFSPYGLLYGDSIGMPLTSGVADFGLAFGALIYAIMGVLYALLWNIVQRTPRVYLAYLITLVTPIDLFWEGGLFALRAIAFVWFVLLLLSPLLMPRWHPPELYSTDVRLLHQVPYTGTLVQ